MTNPYTSNPSATNPERAKFVASVASKNYTGPSIVDFLGMSGYDSSQNSRAQLAKDYNVNNYDFSADANTRLMSALKGNAPTGTETPTGTNIPTGTNTPANNPANTNPDGTPKSAADIAFEEYLNALKPSQDEIDAKNYVIDLTKKAREARQKALDQGETLGFSQGFANKVDTSNNLSIQSAKDAYDVLSGTNKQNAEIAKLKYDYQKGKVDEIKKAKEPFTLSAGNQRYEYDTKTGQYKIVASAPTKATTTKVKPITATEKKNNAYDGINQLLDNNAVFNDGVPVLDSNGYITQEALKRIIRAAAKDGITEAEVMKRYSGYIYKG